MSNTVSVETAGRLKAAGLVWQPKAWGRWWDESGEGKGVGHILGVMPYWKQPRNAVIIRVDYPGSTVGYLCERESGVGLRDHIFLPTAGDLWRILADAQTSLHLETHECGVRLHCIWRSDLWRGDDIESTFEGSLEEALGEAVIEMLERSKQSVG